MDKRWMTAAKIALAAAILGFVGWQFHRDLMRPELELLEFRWGWAALSGVLYLAGLCCSAWFWRHLLVVLLKRPESARPVGTEVAQSCKIGWHHPLRAYFLGHLGKYVPGKAWALFLRGTLVRPTGAPLGLAILTAFYEVLTTMATGALVAIVVFLIVPPQVSGLAWHPVYTGLLLLGLLGVPLLPGVFNVMLRRLSRRFPGIVGEELPPLGIDTLARGMLTTGVGWGLLGLSVWAMLQAVLPSPPDLDAELWARLTGANALAYVAGFLAVFMPSGVGVREYFLLALLGFAGPEALIALAVLLLRLTWTVVELIVAGIFVVWR